MRIFFAVFFTIMILTLPALAQKVCTEMWCQEGMTLTLETSRTMAYAGWPTGNYVFEIEADGKRVTCRTALPLKSDCTPTTQCDGAGAAIGESGCALPQSAHSFNAVMLTEIPKHIALRIVFPDERVFTYQTDVTAQCGYPNGKQCDPRACCSAAATAVVGWR